MYDILPQQIIINAGQLFAAINEELTKLIPKNIPPQEINNGLNNQAARIAAKQYEYGHDDFQTVNGMPVHVTGRTGEIKPQIYKIPIRWDIYKFFHIEAPDLQTAIERALDAAQLEYHATTHAADDTLRLDDEGIYEQFPEESENIDFTKYPI